MPINLFESLFEEGLVRGKLTTPLHLARTGEVTALLLNRRADWRRQDDDGNTALHIAAQHRDAACALALSSTAMDHHLLQVQVTVMVLHLWWTRVTVTVVGLRPSMFKAQVTLRLRRWHLLGRFPSH